MRSDAPRGSWHLSRSRTGSTYVVPESGSPPSKHIIPGPSRQLSPPLVPSRTFALGVWANHDALSRHHRVFGRPGNQRIYERSAASMGFLLFWKTLWRLPMHNSDWYRHTCQSRKFSEALAPSGAPPGFPGRGPFRVTGLSKSYQSQAA